MEFNPLYQALNHPERWQPFSQQWFLHVKDFTKHLTYDNVVGSDYLVAHWDEPVQRAIDTIGKARSTITLYRHRMNETLAEAIPPWLDEWLKQVDQEWQALPQPLATDDTQIESLAPLMADYLALHAWVYAKELTLTDMGTVHYQQAIRHWQWLQNHSEPSAVDSFSTTSWDAHQMHLAVFAQWQALMPQLMKPSQKLADKEETEKTTTKKDDQTAVDWQVLWALLDQELAFMTTLWQSGQAA